MSSKGNIGGGKLRVVFIGSSRFGLRCFQKLLAVPQCELVGVITNPPVFPISYERGKQVHVTNVLHSDIAAVAAGYGIPVWTMEGKMTDPDLLSRALSWSPSLFVVAGWYHMVPKALREIAPALGLHASLLPDYSGGAPLVWAIINGEKCTGITLFRMDDGVDSGDILAQAEEAILTEDTIGTLYERIEEAGLRLIEANIPLVARCEARYSPQDNAKRRTFPQRSPADGRIDWTWPAGNIYNFVRAQTSPYPGAFAFFGHEKVIFWAAEPDTASSSEREPSVGGAIIGFNRRGIIVSCGPGHGSLLVTSVGTDRLKEMSALEFAGRYNVVLGADKFI